MTVPDVIYKLISMGLSFSIEDREGKECLICGADAEAEIFGKFDNMPESHFISSNRDEVIKHINNLLLV